MDADTLAALRHLLRQERVASLGTLHAGEPFVSMVPYVLAPDGPGLLVHLSALASHTRDLQAHAGCSLMVMQTPAADTFVQALPRATLQGEAAPLDPASGAYRDGRAAYVARFPQAEPIFGLGDFGLWRCVPAQVRFVAGFGRAHTLAGEALSALW